MKVAQLLEKRRVNWLELERLCERMQAPRAPFSFRALFSRDRQKNMARLSYLEYTRFAALYRATCADLALAESYQLPVNTVNYLHRLVGRGHNMLYRRRKFDVQGIFDMLFTEVPQRIFFDPCVRTAFFLFWGLFLLATVMAFWESAFPQFAEQLLTHEQINQLEDNFKKSPNRSFEDNLTMAGFYIWNNTGIGLQCFSWGLLVIPGLYVLCSNALMIGASFGYMSRPDVAAGENFFTFVVAHGPFELTAIVLSAGAGLRLGMSWIAPGQLERTESMRKGGAEALPIMGAAAVMFFLAAMIEGFVSPVASIPFWVKGGVSALSTLLLTFYFVVLGFPRDAGGSNAAG